MVLLLLAGGVRSEQAGRRHGHRVPELGRSDDVAGRTRHRNGNQQTRRLMVTAGVISSRGSTVGRSVQHTGGGVGRGSRRQGQRDWLREAGDLNLQMRVVVWR